MRDRKYIDIPGTKTHELPPLLLHASDFPAESAGDMASVMLDEADDMLPVSGEATDVVEQRRFELALQLIEQYKKLLSHWSWGDSVLEWVRQCEITFESEDTLRRLLHPDVWPHASRASFVNLLMEKDVAGRGVAVDRAVGLRLTFRQPPPIDCISNQFLFYLNSSVAYTAYQKWSHLIPAPATLLPPNRFHFEVLNLES